MKDQTQIVELTQAETEQVEGGFFFVLLGANVLIYAYDAYLLSR